MPYSATRNASGTYDIFQGTSKIATGSAAVLGNYGLSERNLGATAPASPIAIAPQNSIIPTVPISSPDGYVSPNAMTPAGSTMPLPKAPEIQTQYQTSLASSVAAARTALDTTRKEERDAAIKRTEDLYAKLEGIQKESDPEKRATYEQEQGIIQNQLTAAETASKTLATDFENRRSIVGELETLLTEGNNLVQQMRGFGGVSFIRNARVQEAAQLVQARAGVLQATLAGLDGNVSLAHSIINNASAAVASNWEDVLNYNEAVLKLVSSKELTIDGDHRKYAEVRVASAKTDLDTLQGTAEALREAMINPQTAQVYAQAGVTLMDSPEQIARKVSEYSYAKEVRDTANEMAASGFSVLLPGQALPADAQVVTITDPKGRETQYYKKASATGGAGSFTQTQLNSGASASGMSIEAFRALDPDVQNYFVNNKGATAFSQALADVTAGKEDPEAVIADLNTAGLPAPVLAYLTQQVQAAAPQQGGGGFLDRVGSFFGSAFNFLNPF